MPKFRVCVLETRERIHEVEAADEADAEMVAKDDGAEHAITDSFREEQIDWVERIDG